MSERKLVLLYNHADPDESFVSMLTDEEIAQEAEARVKAIKKINTVLKKDKKGGK